MIVKISRLLAALADPSSVGEHGFGGVEPEWGDGQVHERWGIGWGERVTCVQSRSSAEVVCVVDGFAA